MIQICFRTYFYSDWSEEILELVTKYKEEGVVGIDVAGPAEGSDGSTQHVQKVFHVGSHF